MLPKFFTFDPTNGSPSSQHALIWSAGLIAMAYDKPFEGLPVHVGVFICEGGLQGPDSFSIPRVMDLVRPRPSQHQAPLQPQSLVIISSICRILQTVPSMVYPVNCRESMCPLQTRLGCFKKRSRFPFPMRAAYRPQLSPFQDTHKSATLLCPRRELNFQSSNDTVNVPRGGSGCHKYPEIGRAHV